jgi:4-hydroxymandelate oxidase
MHDPDLLRERAAALLPPAVWEYFDQGAAASVSTREAPSRWEHLRLRPRGLRDVSRVSTATTVLGHDLRTPILIAPTTLQRHAHPDGERATATAAARAGSLMCVSSNAGTTFEEIGRTGAPWWVQAYIVRDRGLVTDMLIRAREAGASAVVLTADTPEVGNKRSAGPSIWDLTPPEYLRANVDHDGLAEDALDKADDLSPDTIGWLHDVSGLPVVVKGVLRADDARSFADAGAAAIQVSNHGGRQLDLAVSTADALPEVADAVAGTGTELFVDGGIRRAEHILAALALGARAVFLGRPVLWALATGGADGVDRLLTELTEDLVHVMRVAGAGSLADLTPDLVTSKTS